MTLRRQVRWVVRGKDAASRSYPEDTGETEDAASRRPARADGTRLRSVRDSLKRVGTRAPRNCAGGEKNGAPLGAPKPGRGRGRWVAALSPPAADRSASGAVTVLENSTESSAGILRGGRRP